MNKMNTMTHKGYAARIEYSDEDHCFIGHIAGINDIVGFHGDSVAQLRTAFEDAVEDYLETCEKLNRSPQKPYSGNLMLRLPQKSTQQLPQLPKSVAKASINGQPIHSLISCKQLRNHLKPPRLSHPNAPQSTPSKAHLRVWVTYIQNHPKDSPPTTACEWDRCAP